MRGRTIRAALAVLAVPLLTGALASCGAQGWGDTGGAGTVRVLMVNNPQMIDLQKLAPEFTKETGIKLSFTVLPEDDLRDKASQEFSSQAHQYDVATLSNYEIPFYSKNGWLEPLDRYVRNDASFDQADILKPIAQSLTGDDGKIYGEPFYGESSFLMYRKDVFAKKGLTMPPHPTWQQVAALAAKADGAQQGMRGICLRGQPGWGQVLAPFTTLVNTFGGTWFDKDWNAQVDSPAFKQAADFYVDLVRRHGEVGAAQAGFTECLTNLQQGKVAMWYDATSAAGSLEAKGSPVAGKIGYVPAPVVKTKTAGWLFAWSWAIEKASDHKDKAARFVEWASSKKYEELVGRRLGWANVPAGKRTSTYSNPDYLKIAGAFAKPTLSSIQSVDPRSPGVQPRPWVGIQFVDIPEFTDFGTKFSQEFSAAIAGKQSVQSALDTGQDLASTVGDTYK
ncbi:sorbitol/mannitol transport system substrate-binding protein [Jatrophihabitans endophyticus]|uniref:Sorbitol/mannitol transport system substrate-binding protein n=1 Tax=Jatrophihabitans endophyticus TaxID=1206085 RepID=A0A1M5HF60_9ACTN|nr:sugar ABC transporter substrate-binding protein [Jatrophihabitans endophyticus]SHG14557.1 sorbitol/mannitol transport system substrate-binding protein [Jatrophihabitans endophyticus]